MASDVMTVRLHLRRIRVIDVTVDLPERLEVSVEDVRRVSRCPDCGFTTARVHDTRPVRVRDLESHGRPTTLVWQRRRFECGECFERHWEDHPEFILGRRTHVTRRLARRLVADANVMSIREVSRCHQIGWHYSWAWSGPGPTGSSLNVSVADAGSCSSTKPACGVDTGM